MFFYCLFSRQQDFFCKQRTHLDLIDNIACCPLLDTYYYQATQTRYSLITIPKCCISSQLLTKQNHCKLIQFNPFTRILGGSGKLCGKHLGDVNLQVCLIKNLKVHRTPSQMCWPDRQTNSSYCCTFAVPMRLLFLTPSVNCFSPPTQIFILCCKALFH
jgi:hypothetical protein